VNQTLLSLNLIMLNDGGDERLLSVNAYLARVDFYVLHVPFINTIAVLGKHHTATIVETLQMGTRDSHINASDHHVALLFGTDYRFVHAFHCRFEIDDLSLAHAARWRLTHTEDLDGAVGTAFANNDTDLRRANLKTDHQFIAR